MAAWLVALILMLGVLAVYPDAHELLHADAQHGDHACAVTLFAHGVSTVAAILALAVVSWRWVAYVVVRREFFVLAPAYIHLPGRAPPLG